MKISDFIALKDERLPSHEEVIQRGLLYEVEEIAESPGKLVVYHTHPMGKRGDPILYPITEDGAKRDTEERVFHRSRFTAISHRWLQPSRDPLGWYHSCSPSSISITVCCLLLHVFISVYICICCDAPPFFSLYISVSIG